jgi:RNA polymerase-binding transcription factor DksA
VEAPDQQHGGDAGPDGPDLSVLRRVEDELRDVERALGALDDGTYGTCEVCGAAVSDERLATEPTSRRCGEHTAEG